MLKKPRPNHIAARARKRQLLILLGGMAILTAVALSGATPDDTTAQEHFPALQQSLSLAPPTVT